MSEQPPVPLSEPFAPPVPPVGGDAVIGLAERAAPVRERTFLALLGLVILWVTLALMFKAHTLSDTFVVVGMPSDSKQEIDSRYLPLVNSRDKLMLPIAMSWWGVSPRQALSLIAEKLDFEIVGADGVLGLVSDQKQRIHLEDMTLGGAIHRLIGRQDVGFGLRGGRELLLFPQAIAVEPFAGDLSGAGPQVDGILPRSLDWTAELPVTAQPLIVSPTGQADLRLSIYLRGQPAGVGNDQRIALELWNGPVWLAMTPIDLNRDGVGGVNLSNAEQLIEVALTRIRAERGAGPALYRVRLTFSANGAGQRARQPIVIGHTLDAGDPLQGKDQAE